MWKTSNTIQLRIRQFKGPKTKCKNNSHLKNYKFEGFSLNILPQAHSMKGFRAPTRENTIPLPSSKPYFIEPLDILDNKAFKRERAAGGRHTSSCVTKWILTTSSIVHPKKVSLNLLKLRCYCTMNGKKGLKISRSVREETLYIYI